jgi:hypothetical protein
LYPLRCSWSTLCPGHLPPSSCHMFYYTHIREAIWEMNTSRVVDEEGF